MHFFILILLFINNAFPEIDLPVNVECNLEPDLEKITFIPPANNNSDGLINISGKEFSGNTTVTMAGKRLVVVASDENKISANIKKEDYQDGTYKILVWNFGCPHKAGRMDATISNFSETTVSSTFTTKKTQNVPVYPYSYAEIQVSCSPEEKAISGGFVFSTWEVKLVSSYPDGTTWRFKVYNNEGIVSQFNEFYAVCVR